MNMSNPMIDFLRDCMTEETWRVREGPLDWDILRYHVKNAVCLFRCIRGADELWSRRVQEGRAPRDPEALRTIRAAYDWWLAPCQWLYDRIVAWEKAFPVAVDGAEEFRRAWLEARTITMTSIDELMEDATDRGISLDELVEKVRRA